MVERDDVKRLEEVRKKMKEKQKENIEKLSARFEEKRKDDRMPSARPIFSPDNLTDENTERPHGKPKYEQKRVAKIPVMDGNCEDIIKESDVTIIHKEKPTQFRAVMHECTGEMHHAPFPSRLNPMPVQEGAKDASPVAKLDEEL